MFKRNFTLLIIIFILGVMMGAPPSAAAREKTVKMGVIDLSRIFDEYKRTQDADAELGSEGQAKQEERKETVAEIRRLKDEIELLSESGRASKQKKIDAKIKELQGFDQKVREGLRNRRDNMVRDILKEIQVVIDNYSQSKGYDLILSDRMLLFSDGQMDVTNEIIGILNNQYEERNQ